MSCTVYPCDCKAYVDSTSKWRKGKCNTCDHSESKHTGSRNRSKSPRPSHRPRAQSELTNVRLTQTQIGQKFIAGLKSAQSKTPKVAKPVKSPKQRLSLLVVEESKSNDDVNDTDTKLRPRSNSRTFQIIEDLQKKITELKHENEMQQNKMNEYETSKNNLNEALQRSKYMVSTHEQSIKDLNDILDDAQRQRIEMEKENKTLKQQQRNQNKEMDGDLKRLKIKHKTEIDEQKRLMNKLQSDNNKLAAQNREYGKYKKQIETVTQQRDTIMKEIAIVRESAKSERDALLKQMDALKARNDALSEQITISNDESTTREEPHADCNDAMELLRGDLKVFQQQEEKWKTQYFEKLNAITAMRNEIMNVQKEKEVLKGEVDALESELVMMKRRVLTHKHVSAPCEEDEMQYISALPDDDLCKLLQTDLENYTIQYKMKTNKKKLKELRRFHEDKARMVWNWEYVLKRNYYDKLVDELLDEYEENENENKNETLAYNVLFDAVIECYDALHTEYYAYKASQNSNVIDAIWLNVDTFYDLKRKCKLKEALLNVYTYIERKIKEIQNEILKKECAKHLDEDRLFPFIVQCSQHIWSALHYEYTIDPMHFTFNAHDAKYDDTIYEREGCYRGTNIKYCTFPALMNNQDEYQTKVWVICDDIE